LQKRGLQKVFIEKINRARVMNIQILFDQKVSSRKYAGGWGFSVLVDGYVLFDTGCNGKQLIKNIEQLQIDIKKIKAVVVSHNHWDHRGGLRAILERALHPDVWLGKQGFDARQLKKIQVQGKCVRYPGFFSEIGENIFTTGEIEGKFLWKKISEQSLIIKSKNGLTVITGCAHSGILKILETVREKFKEKFYLVVGGFHLFGKRREMVSMIIKRLKELGVEKVAPCHCSGKTAFEMFRDEYGSSFIELKVGDSVEV